MLNIEGSQDLKNFEESGAGAVGLYRTESLFIRQNAFPDETTQYTEYAAVVRAAGGQPVTMRSLDMGGTSYCPRIPRPRIALLWAFAQYVCA